MSRGNDDIEYAELTADKSGFAEAGISIALTDTFEAHTKQANEEHLVAVDKELAGGKSGSLEGFIERSAAATFNSYSKIISDDDLKKKRAFDDQMFLALLSVDARIAQLDADIAKGLESLYETYGDHEGLADVFLTPEEREGLDTEEEVIAALADKYLDEDGKLKPEYSDLDPALVGVLKDWHERNELLKTVNDPESSPENIRSVIDGANYEQVANVAGRANNAFAQEAAENRELEIKDSTISKGVFTIPG